MDTNKIKKGLGRGLSSLIGETKNGTDTSLLNNLGGNFVHISYMVNVIRIMDNFSSWIFNVCVLFLMCSYCHKETLSVIGGIYGINEICR